MEFTKAYWKDVAERVGRSFITGCVAGLGSVSLGAGLINGGSGLEGWEHLGAAVIGGGLATALTTLKALVGGNVGDPSNAELKAANTDDEDDS